MMLSRVLRFHTYKRTVTPQAMADGSVLHGASVNHQTHGKGQHQAEAAGFHNNTEAEAQYQIARQHRKGGNKGRLEQLFHRITSLSMGIVSFYSIRPVIARQNKFLAADGEQKRKEHS